MLQELGGYDWQEAFAIADVRAAHPQRKVSLSAVDREDVVKVVALDEGENDGPDWLCFGKLKDGRWFLLSAGCDYTGWDCQAGGSVTVAKTKTELMQYGVTDYEKRRLGLT